MGVTKEYYEWLAASVGRYETLAKTLVEHKPEKGRIVEGIVKASLRAILPSRYSLGTGFVITAGGDTSPQLDVVIYDAFENAPIILEAGVGVFPIECVYGFVEVKSKLDSDGIESAAKAIAQVRSYASQKTYEGYAVNGGEEPVSIPMRLGNDLPPRSYLFALRTSLSEAKLMKSLEEQAQAHDAHFHALAVMDPNFFAAQRPYKRPLEFVTATDKAMARFGSSVLHGVQSFPMSPASMSKYLGD